jgi:hypothetical protein
MVIRFTALAALAALVVAGCGPSGRVVPEDIEVREDTPLKQAEKLLTNYSKGQQLGSEATQFEYLTKEVTKTDPTRGDILAKGFAELQKTPKGGVAAKAKDILKQLAPKQREG